MAKITGKSGVFTIAGNPLNFRKISPKTARKMADATDSANYDLTSDLIWPVQLPVMAPITVTVEGWYDTTLVPTAFVSTLYTGILAQACVIKYGTGITFGHGNFDISDFETGIPIDDTVSYSMTAMSNGIFTQGS